MASPASVSPNLEDQGVLKASPPFEPLQVHILGLEEPYDDDQGHLHHPPTPNPQPPPFAPSYRTILPENEKHSSKLPMLSGRLISFFQNCPSSKADSSCLRSSGLWAPQPSSSLPPDSCTGPAFAPCAHGPMPKSPRPCLKAARDSSMSKTPQDYLSGPPHPDVSSSRHSDASAADPPAQDSATTSPWDILRPHNSTSVSGALNAHFPPESQRVHLSNADKLLAANPSAASARATSANSASANSASANSASAKSLSENVASANSASARAASSEPSSALNPPYPRGHYDPFPPSRPFTKPSLDATLAAWNGAIGPGATKDATSFQISSFDLPHRAATRASDLAPRTPPPSAPALHYYLASECSSPTPSPAEICLHHHLSPPTQSTGEDYSPRARNWSTCGPSQFPCDPSYALNATDPKALPAPHSMGVGGHGPHPPCPSFLLSIPKSPAPPSPNLGSRHASSYGSSPQPPHVPAVPHARPPRSPLGLVRDQGLGEGDSAFPRCASTTAISPNCHGHDQIEPRSNCGSGRTTKASLGQQQWGLLSGAGGASGSAVLPVSKTMPHNRHAPRQVAARTSPDFNFNFSLESGSSKPRPGSDPIRRLLLGKTRQHRSFQECCGAKCGTSVVGGCHVSSPGSGSGCGSPRMPASPLRSASPCSSSSIGAPLSPFSESQARGGAGAMALPSFLPYERMEQLPPLRPPECPLRSQRTQSLGSCPSPSVHRSTGCSSGRIAGIQEEHNTACAQGRGLVPPDSIAAFTACPSPCTGFSGPNAPLTSYPCPVRSPLRTETEYSHSATWVGPAQQPRRHSCSRWNSCEHLEPGPEWDMSSAASLPTPPGEFLPAHGVTFRDSTIPRGHWLFLPDDVSLWEPELVEALLCQAARSSAGQSVWNSLPGHATQPMPGQMDGATRKAASAGKPGSSDGTRLQGASVGEAEVIQPETGEHWRPARNPCLQGEEGRHPMVQPGMHFLPAKESERSGEGKERRCWWRRSRHGQSLSFLPSPQVLLRASDCHEHKRGCDFGDQFQEQTGRQEGHRQSTRLKRWSAWLKGGTVFAP